MRLLAQLISSITNPFLLAFPIPFILVYRATEDTYYAMLWAIFSTLFIILVGLFVYYSVKRGFFTDLDISKRTQRPAFYLFVSLIAVLYLLSIFFLDAPVVLFIAILAVILAVVVFSFVNTRVKASLHVASSSAIVVVLSMVYGGWFYLGILAVPIIAWSRLVLKRHTKEEVFVGGSLGISLALFVYVVTKAFIPYK